MKSVGEIQGLVKSFQQDTNFINLRKRWEKDYDLARLKPYDAGKGYYSYTTNYPHNLLRKSLSMLTEANIIVRYPDELLDDNEKTTANNNERFVYGCLTINDERRKQIPKTPRLQNEMAWYLLVRGSCGILVYVYKDTKGKTVTRIDLFDPYNMAYGIGEDGLEWAAYTYQIESSYAKNKYGIAVGKTTKTVKCIDFWDKEGFQRIINNLEKETVTHDLGYCPVGLIQAGSTPVVWQDNFDSTLAEAGESLFKGVRDITPMKNKTLSDWLTIVRRGVKPPMGVWSPDGKTTLESDIWQVEKGAALPMKDGVVVKPILEPSVPEDAKLLVQVLSGEEQTGGISNVAMGNVASRMSGFLFNQVMSEIADIITPFAQSMEDGYDIITRQLLNQFGGSKLPPITVRGRNSKGQPFGLPKGVDIKPSMVKADWHPLVSVKPLLAKQDPQRYELARRATEGEDPLVSKRYAWTELLELQDPDLLEEQISHEFGKNRPEVKLQKSFMAALVAEDYDTAMALLSALMSLKQQGQRQGMPTGGNMNPLERFAQANPTVGVPTGETGVNPETMPGEMMGGTPPGIMNAQIP